MLIEALHAVGLERAEGVEVAWNLYKSKRPTWAGRGVGRGGSLISPYLFYPKFLIINKKLRRISIHGYATRSPR